MSEIILHGISLEDLLNRMGQLIDEKLKKEASIPHSRADEFITRKEVASALRVSLPTLHQWTKEGVLPSYKIGNRVLYKKLDIDRLITSKQAYKHKHGAY